MDLFTYLMAKNGNNSSVHGDLFSYLLGKGQSQIYTISGTTIYIPNAKKLVSFMMTKESTQATSILPSEYTQVDYIESHGTEYIDILYNFTSEFAELKMNAQLMELSTTDTAKALCGRSVSSTGRIFYLSQNSLYGFYFQTGSTTATNIVSNISDTNKHYFNCVVSDKNYFYLDNNLIGSSTKNSSILNENLFCVFARKGNNNEASNFSKMKLYDLKLYDNNVLICDLIPCYRNLDNEVGAYDLVNNVFYTNQGTGAFTYGSVASIPNPDYPQEVNVVEGYRNLFDKDNANILNNVFVSTNVSSITPQNGAKCIYIPIKPNTTYTFSKIKSARFAIATTSNLPAQGVSISDKVQNNDATSLTLTSSSTANYLVAFVYFSTYDTLTLQKILDSIMIVEGSTELPYVPYGNNYVAVNVNDGNTTNSYPIPLNNNELVGKSTNLDQLIVDKSGNVYINKIFAKIDSYNGETITTDYWSTTGGLDTGATIYYVMNEPQLIDLNTTVDLRLFKGANTITNSEDGYMTIEYR